MDRDNEIVIPISTAMRRVMNVDTLRAVKLLVRDPGRMDETARDVTRVLRDRHALAEGQPNDFTLMTSSAVQRNVAQRAARPVPLPAAGGGHRALAGGAVAATLMSRR